MDQRHREKLRELLHYANALSDSMEKNLEGEKNITMRYTSYWHYCRKYNQLIEQVAAVTELPPVIDLFDIDRMPKSSNMLPANQKENYEAVHANLSILKAYLEGKLGLIVDEIENLKNFLASNLRKALFNEPNKEVAVQDGIEALLIGRGFSRGIDYDRETGRVKVSIKEVVPDFIFPRLGLALEVKLAKDHDRLKSLIDQINADIQSYSKKYQHIVFLIYDLGTIRDEFEFKHGLESANGISVIVVKH